MDFCENMEIPPMGLAMSEILGKLLEVRFHTMLSKHSFHIMSMTGHSLHTVCAWRTFCCHFLFCGYRFHIGCSKPGKFWNLIIQDSRHGKLLNLFNDHGKPYIRMYAWILLSAILYLNDFCGFNILPLNLVTKTMNSLGLKKIHIYSLNLTQWINYDFGHVSGYLHWINVLKVCLI